MKEVKGSFDPNSEEYTKSTALASYIRNTTNGALGDILLVIEASVPHTEPCEAAKQLVKQRMWRLMDDNQHSIYLEFGIEPHQLGDPTKE